MLQNMAVEKVLFKKMQNCLEIDRKRKQLCIGMEATFTFWTDRQQKALYGLVQNH